MDLAFEVFPATLDLAAIPQLKHDEYDARIWLH